jgi:hypothetical protein
VKPAAVHVRSKDARRKCISSGLRQEGIIDCFDAGIHVEQGLNVASRQKKWHAVSLRH